MFIFVSGGCCYNSENFYFLPRRVEEIVIYGEKENEGEEQGPARRTASHSYGQGQGHRWAHTPSPLAGASLNRRQCKT